MTTRRDLLRLAALAAAWPGEALPQAKKPKPAPGTILVNDVHSQLNSARVFRIAAPHTLDEVRAELAAARKEERPVCLSGARHAMGGQQFCADAVLLDSRKLDRVLDFDTERGLLEVESGIEWPEVLEHLHVSQRGLDKAWAFAQKQAGADRLTLGGSLAANMHGRGLAMPPFVNDIESFKLVTARGNVLNCSRSENPELFRLAIGGYGLFGFVYSLKLRLVPRRKLERVVEVRDIDGLAQAFDERVRAGYLYGEFECSIDDKSQDFLRKGVFSCYRPVEDGTPLPALQRELPQDEWVDLMYAAHTDKAQAFARAARYYQSTNGRVYWSDEVQMSVYAEDYHRVLDRKMDAPTKATEATTEILCERPALERFMDDVRAYARREGVNIVGAGVRLIEPDRESFLAWARKPSACVSFNVHIEHSTGGVIRGADALRRLVDMGLRHGGGYYLAYNRYALQRQVLACYPQFPEFLKLKRKYDREELFQSEWYRHYKRMFLGEK